MKCFMTNQECILGRSIHEQSVSSGSKKLFMISPFGYPYDDIFTRIIKLAAERENLDAQRADQAFQLGFVMCQKICKLMQEADYIVADVTEENPNVYYELGLAWGFGKKVHLIVDTDAEHTPGFKSLFNTFLQSGKVLSYEELLPFESAQTKTFLNLLNEHAISVEQEYGVSSMRQQEAYINFKNILFFFQDGLPDKKLYLRVLEEVIEQMNKDSEDMDKTWKLLSLPLADGPLNIFSSDSIKSLSSSKIFVVDITHYDEKVNGVSYFILGLAHSLGREAVPITNRAKCGALAPFDVQGLWQVHFERIDTLCRGLRGILLEIDKDFRRERTDYPLTFIWDKILKPLAKLKVLTCARAAAADKNRPGGRTNVDKWDYTSVGELAAFLARKYRDTSIDIAAPEEKVTEELHTVNEKLAQANMIEKRLCNITNSLIIIGSPDVSDYAEIVLAKAYGITPYEPQECEWDKNNKNKQRKCWECTKETNCVGKRGYLFCKETASTHPREMSCFFRVPPKRTKECVVWYGEIFECTHSRSGDSAEGKTFGVLTILKDQPHLFGTDKKGKQSFNKWIVLLSGFTGIGTYGLTKLLTSLGQPEQAGTHQQSNTLKEWMDDKKIDIDIEGQGIQVLLAVNYKSGKSQKSHDARVLQSYTIESVKPLLEKHVMADEEQLT